jgi:hypothetical protein
VTPEQIRHLQDIKKLYQSSGQDPAYVDDVIAYYRNVLGQEVDEATVIGFLAGTSNTPPGATPGDIRSQDRTFEEQQGLRAEGPTIGERIMSVPGAFVNWGRNLGGREDSQYRQGIVDQASSLYAFGGGDPRGAAEPPESIVVGQGGGPTIAPQGKLTPQEAIAQAMEEARLAVTPEELGRGAIGQLQTTPEGRSQLYRGALGRTFPTGLPSRLESQAFRMFSPIQAQWELSRALGTAGDFSEFISRTVGEGGGPDPGKMSDMLNQVAGALPTMAEKQQGLYGEKTAWKQRLDRDYSYLTDKAKTQLWELSNNPALQFNIGQQVASQNMPVAYRNAFTNVTTDAWDSYATDPGNALKNPIDMFTRGYNFLGVN